MNRQGLGIVRKYLQNISAKRLTSIVYNGFLQLNNKKTKSKTT